MRMRTHLNSALLLLLAGTGLSAQTSAPAREPDPQPQLPNQWTRATYYDNVGVPPAYGTRATKNRAQTRNKSKARQAKQARKRNRR